MKLRKTKKGFTVVELVIVIAVIAVLAAILIPTFISLDSRAKKASDQSLVRNLNVALQAQENEVDDEPNMTMHDAVEDLDKWGYKLDALVTKSGEDLLWNMKTNRFFLSKDESKEEGTQLDHWKIQKDYSASDKHSVYASDDWTGSKSITDLAVGFDAGDRTDFEVITYVGSSSAQNVVIRTTGNLCVFTVNAASDHVDHFGYARTTNVQAVNSENSYHEYGTSSSLVVTAGKVVIEETGIVFNLSATEGASATVSNNGGNVMESSIPSVPQSTNFEINSLAQLESFRDATNSGETFAGKRVLLNKDIALSKAWKPISNYYRKTNKDKWFAGEFDGQGHTISGLNNKGILSRDLNTGYNSTTPVNGTEVVYGLFASIGGNANIHDLKLAKVEILDIDGLYPDGVGALVGYTEGNVQIRNIEVSGSVTGYDAVGGIIGRSRGTTALIENCTNNAEVKAIRQCAGIIGQLGDTSESGTINNCKNTGNVTCEYMAEYGDLKSAGYYWSAGIANINTSNTSAGVYVIHGCTNTGTIANNGHLPEQHANLVSTLGSTLNEGKVTID